ncbi:MAG: hypothetical protein ACTSR8_09595 [Promethearchaeota archaeon]
MALMDTPIKFDKIVKNLMTLVPDIIAVAIIEGSNDIVYSTDNWDISAEFPNISAGWDALKLPMVNISGVKYTTLQLEVDTLVATSVKGEGHIVGFKDEERIILTYIVPEGDRKAAIVELSRVIRSFSSSEPYLNEGTKLQPKYRVEGPVGATVNPELEKEIKAYLAWMKDENGLPGYLNYYISQNDEKILSELAKFYYEFREIFGV